jgi:hypothetical protein|tara:strand:+ start:4453 stop:5463 length:1011 start_codon:yes stop_codon:yes gene_type:complete
MANPIDLIITNAGLDALVDAQNGNTDAIKVIEVGLTEAAFDPAPTLTALPGEFKRLASFAGQSTGPNTIHMTALDAGATTYDLRGIGLFLEDGTLFASFAQAAPIFSKVAIASFLLAFDVRFSGDVGEDITFGDATFLYPPASETVKGVAEIATQEETDAVDDDERIVTPLKLGVFVNSIASALQAAIDALTGRTITGTGLATGGGSLAANRTINVAAASGAEAMAEDLATKAITPASLAGFARQVGQSGYATIPGTGGMIIQHGRFTAAANGPTSVTWPIAFPTACYAAVCNGGKSDAAIQDNYVTFLAESISATGATAYNNQTTYSASFIAIGR